MAKSINGVMAAKAAQWHGVNGVNQWQQSKSGWHRTIIWQNLKSYQ